MRQKETHRLFCDEAGNTGGNYIDQAQPVMVFASWLIPRDQEDSVLSMVDAFTSRSTARELHAKQMLRRPSGWNRARDLIERMLKSGATPFFFVVEKRYQLAERIIHALLDNVTNPRAHGFPSIGNPGYLELIEFLYLLPDQAARRYAEAIARPTENSVREGIMAVAAAVRSSGQPKLARALEGCLENLAEVMDYDFSDRTGHKHSQVTSPHLPGCMRMLEAVDAYAERRGYGLVGVVHDETMQYGPVLQQRVEMMREVGFRGKIRNVPAGFPDIGFAHVHSFDLASSDANRCIQTADLLATSIARLVRNALHGRAWTAAEHSIANRILGPLLTDNLEYGGLSVSVPLCNVLRECMTARIS